MVIGIRTYLVSVFPFFHFALKLIGRSPDQESNLTVFMPLALSCTRPGRIRDILHNPKHISTPRGRLLTLNNKCHNAAERMSLKGDPLPHWSCKAAKTRHQLCRLIINSDCKFKPLNIMVQPGCRGVQPPDWAVSHSTNKMTAIIQTTISHFFN